MTIMYDSWLDMIIELDENRNLFYYLDEQYNSVLGKLATKEELILIGFEIIHNDEQLSL